MVVEAHAPLLFTDRDIYMLFMNELSNGIDTEYIDKFLSPELTSTERFYQRNKLINEQVGNRLAQGIGNRLIAVFSTQLEAVRESYFPRCNVIVLPIPSDIDEVQRQLTAVSLSDDRTHPVTAWRQRFPIVSTSEISFYTDNLEQMQDRLETGHAPITHDRYLLDQMRSALGIIDTP